MHYMIIQTHILVDTVSTRDVHLHHATTRMSVTLYLAVKRAALFALISSDSSARFSRTKL